METGKYGQHYWCVKVTEDIAANGSVYVTADVVDIGKNGELIFMRDMERTLDINLIIAAGKWLCVFAASTIDGSPVAAEHWGE